jgi:putative endonuclease
VNAGERRAALHYRIRGYRVLDRNARAGGGELDLVLRRGRKLVFAEVKERSHLGYGGGIRAVDTEKRRRVTRAARAWLRSHPEASELDVVFEAVAVRQGSVRRYRFDPVDGPLTTE